MFSTLLVGLVLSIASVVTTASRVDVATSGDGITCEPLFAISYSDCVNDYHRLHDNGGITVDIGMKGHLDPLRTGTVELVSDFFVHILLISLKDTVLLSQASRPCHHVLTFYSIWMRHGMIHAWAR